MDKLLTGAKLLMYVSIAFFFVCLSVMLLKLLPDVRVVIATYKATDLKTSIVTTLDGVKGSVQDVVSTAKPVISNLVTTETKLNTTLDRVDALCPPKASDELHPCGTIADVGKTLNTVRSTFGQIEIAANHEDKNLTNLDSQENQLFQDFHGTATKLNLNLDTSQTTISNFNKLLTSPELLNFMTSSAATSQQVAVIATEGAGISKDLHKEADVLVSPQPWYKKVYNFGNTGVNVACLITHSCPF